MFEIIGKIVITILLLIVLILFVALMGIVSSVGRDWVQEMHRGETKREQIISIMITSVAIGFLLSIFLTLGTLIYSIL